ncbi:hypothetical protein [Streptomyces atratus]|uniref:hypothetical protein n=1 Tax=Streptomyces atratus TaxID=1893 RepID=UPI001300374F|nr:hypothetical protein [Streptomyces atratus]
MSRQRGPELTDHRYVEGVADPVTSPSAQIPPPRLSVDGGGVLTVQATPEWLQRMAHAPDWTDFAEQLAAAGGAAVDHASASAPRLGQLTPAG